MHPPKSTEYRTTSITVLLCRCPVEHRRASTIKPASQQYSYLHLVRVLLLTWKLTSSGRMPAAIMWCAQPYEVPPRHQSPGVQPHFFHFLLSFLNAPSRLLGQPTQLENGRTLRQSLRPPSPPGPPYSPSTCRTRARSYRTRYNAYT